MTLSDLLSRAIQGDPAAAKELGRLLDNLQGQAGIGIGRRSLDALANNTPTPGLNADQLDGAHASQFIVRQWMGF